MKAPHGRAQEQFAGWKQTRSNSPTGQRHKMCFSGGRSRPVAITAICRARPGPSALCPICPRLPRRSGHVSARRCPNLRQGRERPAEGLLFPSHTASRSAGNLVLILQVTEGQRGEREGPHRAPTLAASLERSLQASNLTAPRPDRFLASSQHRARAWERQPAPSARHERV